MVCLAGLVAKQEAVLVGEKGSASRDQWTGSLMDTLKGLCPLPTGIYHPHPYLGFRIHKS